MKTRHPLLGCIAAAAAFVAVAAAGGGPVDRVNYGRPFEPPTHPAFIPLPPGAVEPQGWLRDWCLSAKNGYTGHMDEYHQEFQRAWAANHTMTGDRLSWPKGGWPYEGGGYWFNGLVRLGYLLHDQELIDQARRRLDVVVSHVNPNGILFLWWLNKNNPGDVKAAQIADEWPFWASGLLGRSLSAYYAASRDERVLRAMEAAYSGDRDWLRMGWGMTNPWPAFDTFTWTGNREIAAGLTALFSANGGGRNTGKNSWNRYRHRPNDEPGAETNDHVVHFLESTTPWVLGYLWTGDREFLEATLAWHRLLERTSMQPSGVPVADEYYGPVGAFRATETCDVAAYLWSQIALVGISGQGSMADRVERAFFNAAPATVSRDFKTHVYMQTPNRVTDMNPHYTHGPVTPGGNSYKPTHFPLCCTAALNRILPNYVMHMWMATYDNGLAATYYGPSKVSALAGRGVPVELTSRTEYPFDDVIEIAVKPSRAENFPLSFRIPGWCRNPEVKVNGSLVSAVPDANGFVRIERQWAPGDTVHLRFPMSVEVASGRDRNSQDAPYASVSYGPLLFALPIPETRDSNTPNPAARWNFALDLRGKRPGADIAVERGPMPARWDWPLAAPIRLRAYAVACDWSPTFERALPTQTVAGRGKRQRITLVPFGSTQFRVSMFPVTERLWTSLPH